MLNYSVLHIRLEHKGTCRGNIYLVVAVLIRIGDGFRKDDCISIFIHLFLHIFRFSYRIEAIDQDFDLRQVNRQVRRHVEDSSSHKFPVLRCQCCRTEKQ